MKASIMKPSPLPFVLLVLAAPLSIRPATYYVNNTAASASDANAATAEAPLKTISAGLAKAYAGDTVLALDGVYMESVVFSRSGAPGKPIVLKAGQSKTVWIRGADTVANFRNCTRDMVRGNPNYASIWWAELPGNRSWEKWDASLQNIGVLQDNQPLKTSRWPVSAWFTYQDLYTNSCTVQSGDSVSIIDVANLNFSKGALEGCLVTFIDVSAGKSPCYRMAAACDSALHRLTVNRPFPAAVEPLVDLYYLENGVSFMSRPGEFVIDTLVKPGRLYLWPLDNKDPNACTILALKNGSSQLITWAAGVSYIVIDGFYLSDAGQLLGIGSQNSGSHIEIKNCVLARASIFLVNQSFCAITHCVQTGASGNGISISLCSDIDIVENEVYGNESDGITVGQNSRNVNILRNYIHDQWKSNHPDGIQLYRNVRHITIDSNLVFNCGQGIMTQEWDTGSIVNNMIVGTHGAGLTLGYGNATNIVVRNNTLLYAGTATFTTDAPNNTLINNVLGLDYALARYGWKNAKNLVEDYNLFFVGPSPVSAADTASKGLHSIRSSRVVFNYGIAGMASMVNTNNVAASTPSTLRFDATGNFFKNGDFIETNFDGVIRTVTASGPTSVSFTPPLAAVHPMGWDVVINLKALTSADLDLRLATNSDGYSSGVNGTAIGSSIDMRAYRMCDFNGDGKRDIPSVPAGIYKTPYYIQAPVKNRLRSERPAEKAVFSKNRLTVFHSPDDPDFSCVFFQPNGRVVSMVVRRSAGRDRIVFDLNTLANGVYLAVLQRGTERESRCIIIR